MEKKNLNRFVSSVYVDTFNNIGGAVKFFNTAVKDCSVERVQEIAKACNIDAKAARRVVLFYKDKTRTINACKEMYANIDGIFCEYKAVAKDYRVATESEKSFNKIDELKDEMLLGKVYKPYGYKKDGVELLPVEPNYILKETDTVSTTYAPFPVKVFTVKKVVRAVVDYIAACEKNGIDWNKASDNNANA